MSERRGGHAVGMALLLTLIAACAMGTATIAPPPEGVLRVASYNVHYIDLRNRTGDWSVADWETRKGPLDSAFKALDADIVAFQEMESFAGGNDGGTNLARDWLARQNADYAVAAEGDWRDFPSTQPIFYRRDRLAVLDQGWFFFSETPEVIYSRTFDGGHPAFASWGAFRDLETGADLTIVNVHFDYSSGANRVRSAELVAQRIEPWLKAGRTVILAGDLNAMTGWKTHAILDEAGLDFVPVAGSTYHFNRGLHVLGAIDHIAASGGVARAGDAQVLRGRVDGEWPSDHYPVVADFRPAR